MVDICTFPTLRSSRTSTSTGCGPASRSPRRTSSASASRPRPGRSRAERLIDEPIELPRINYGRCNERPYRYVWGVGAGGGWIDRIVKADVVERRSTTWSEEGCFPGEPVFVAAPDADGEDEGVLLSIVLDGRKGNSFLLVLDARSLDELARAEVPHHIPFGFHGQFSRAGAGMEALLERHPLRVAMKARDLEGVAEPWRRIILRSPITSSFRFVGGTDRGAS